MPPTNENITTTTQIDAGVDTYYDKLFLIRALPNLPHMRWGQVRNIPAGSTQNIKWRRYASLTIDKTPLNEVINPNPETLSKTDVNGTTSLYGKVVKLSEKMNLITPDQVGRETTILLSENYEQTLDQLTRDVFGAAASSTTASNGTPQATVINRTDINTVVQTLIGNRARWTAELIKANTGQGTTPIAKAFMGILHTDLIADLEDVSGFVDVANYPSRGAVAEMEWGKTGHVRWEVTDLGYTSGSNYHLPIFGQNAYGLTKIESGGRRLIHHPAKMAGGPLELYETYGWKEYYTATILNNNFMHKLIVTKAA